MFTPGYVDADRGAARRGARRRHPRRHRTRHRDSRRWPPADAPPLPEPLPAGPTRRVPLGPIAGARSGDKGGYANVGVWVRTDEQWRWLAHTLTVDAAQASCCRRPPTAVTRHVLPNLRAVNFVIEGILGQGVAYQARFDPQAKGLGEWLRSRHVDIPEELLPVSIWNTPEREQLRKTVRAFRRTRDPAARRRVGARRRAAARAAPQGRRAGPAGRAASPRRSAAVAATAPTRWSSARRCTRPARPAGCSRRCSPAVSRCRT